MTSGSSGSGGDYLVRMNELTAARKSLPAVKDILIVEDESFDGDRMVGTLRKIFGYDLEIRRAPTLTQALDHVFERLPELIVLDDYLLPSDNALDTIPILRRAKYAGPIIVVSGRLNRGRQSKLIEIGAQATIHKDDLNSVTIVEALVAALVGPGDTEAPA
jgi:DNA-binding NarL/FixJ family response regulator